MITFRKRNLAANTTALLGAIFLASALTAATFVRDDAAATSTSELKEFAPPLEQSGASSGKGDLKIDLADVHKRPVRCVSTLRETTCTGWPLSHGMLAQAEQ